MNRVNIWLTGQIDSVTLQKPPDTYLDVFVLPALLSGHMETSFVSGDGDPARHMCRRWIAHSDSQHMAVRGYRGIKLRCGEPPELRGDHRESIMKRPAGFGLGCASLAAIWTPRLSSSWGEWWWRGSMEVCVCVCVSGGWGGGLGLDWACQSGRLGGSFVWQKRFASLLFFAFQRVSEAWRRRIPRRLILNVWILNMNKKLTSLRRENECQQYKNMRF